MTARVALSASDLIPDRMLGAEDRDAFNHEAIAGRVAELAVSATTPVNIALFGPWGSGKSSLSELMRRVLVERSKRVAVVRYDAWKYGGASLQRNFISHAARELGFDEEDVKNRDFYRGLYEKRRSADLDLGELSRSRLWSLVKWFVAALLLVSALFLAVVGIVTALTDTSFSETITDSYPAFVAPSAVFAFLVALLKMALEGARVDVEQSAPADEQFAGTFRRLVKKSHRKYERLIFFVDELDRCSAEDVVETLADIKNFLDQPDCVFVVAADREVLEQALRELPQTSPVDEETPYYSSASEFLDKVFQHQIALPPLRAQRLTRFARDLVLERSAAGGLWAELKAAAEEDRHLLDRTVYVLIPSHVRSPRRVKVLLNNFATNARIAEARGIGWLDRAQEIAKLTVLQTEFPLLAADLYVEPRLPGFLLNPPAKRSPKLKQLLEHHALPPPVQEEPGEPGELVEPQPPQATESAEPTDPLLAETDKDRLANAQRQQLRRYLLRTAAVPDPARDLLYLEAAGAAVDLEDPELGEFVESAAPDAPGDVLERIVDVTVQERHGVARLLAQMAEQEFGEERANVVTALMGVVEGLGDDVRPVATEVSDCITSLLQEQPLKEEHLVGALVVARIVETGDEAPLTDELFADERLLADVSRTQRVALMADRLDDRHVELVMKQISLFFPADRDVLLEPLREVGSEAAVKLLKDPVLTAVTEHLKALEDQASSEAAEELAEELAETAANRADSSIEVRAAVNWALLSSANAAAYAAAQRRADDVLPALKSPQVADSHVLVAFQQAPPEHWSRWAKHLSNDPKPWDVQGKRAIRGAAFILEQLPAAPADVQDEVTELFAVLVPFIRMARGDEAWTTIEPALQSALATTQWWADPDSRRLQETTHRAARKLKAAGPELEAGVEQLLLADLQRALSAAPAIAETFVGVGEMGGHLSLPSIEVLATALADLAETGNSTRDVELTRARLGLAARAKSEGADVSTVTYNVDPDVVVQAATTKTPAGDDAVLRWLDLDPDFQTAKTLATSIAGDATAGVVAAYGGWAEGLDVKDRSDLLVALLEQAGIGSAWIDAIAAHPIEEERVIDHLATKVQQASRAQERRDVVSLVVAIRPSVPGAQRKVAELILWLLRRDTDVDFNVAVAALPALGTEHRSRGRLEKAFRDAVDHGRKLPERAQEDMRRAKIKLPKKAFKGRKFGPLRF